MVSVSLVLLAHIKLIMTAKSVKLGEQTARRKTTVLNVQWGTNNKSQIHYAHYVIVRICFIWMEMIVRNVHLGATNVVLIQIQI